MKPTSHRAISPGKIILSGEHSVAYAQPAIALAVDRHATAVVESIDAPVVSVSFANQPQTALPLDELEPLVDRLDQLHAEFISGRIPIREVLASPAELLLYAAALTRPRHGLRISIRLDIPHGSGMGSSAAVILALLRAAMPSAARPELMAPALRAENLQHGRSSGIDLHTCLAGGLHYFQGGGEQTLDVFPMPFDLVHTGMPASSTGECVARVRDHHAQSEIWADFGEVTRATAEAHRNSDAAMWRQAIRANHRLLQSIGVVPAPVAAFIREVEDAGGAAKICGAGSVEGDCGGIVLATGVADIAGIVARRGYEHVPVGMDRDGTRLD